MSMARLGVSCTSARMRSEGYSSWVCLSVCLTLLRLQLTSQLLGPLTNDIEKAINNRPDQYSDTQYRPTENDG